MASSDTDKEVSSSTTPELNADFDWRTLPNALDNGPWYKNEGLRKLYWITSVVYMGQFLNGYDGTILGSLLALDRWNHDLGYPDANQIGYLNAMSYIAGFISGPIASWAADKYGRKFCMQYYAVTMMIGTILGCIAGIPQLEGKGLALFCVSKFIIGSGLATALMTMQILLQEISHPRQRPIVAGAFNQSWTLGHVLSAWLSFATSHRKDSWQWRVPYLVQAGFAVYMSIGIFMMPESPRFLASKGRFDEARAWLVKYHGNGNPDDELVKFEYQEMLAGMAQDEKAKGARWRNLLKSKPNRQRMWLAAMFTMIPQWSGGAIINFYYTRILTSVGVTGAATQTGIGAGLSMWGWCVQVASYFVMARVKRRTHMLCTWPFLIAFNVAVTVASAMYAKDGSQAAGIAAVFFVWMYSGADQFVTGIFYSYTGEIMSYELRAKGLAVWTLVNQATGCFNAYVNSIALSEIGWRYYLVYTGLLVIWFGLLYYFMVETYGKTLEEMEIIFLGEKSAVAKLDAQLEAGASLDGVDVAQVTAAGEKDKASI
ncbi:uncharacterized protein JCM10292_003084 [Rhodotorula paludigena]|uniref:uncharacterized protein n=1 Tax=Rhodotorula paludigena TaxID=86838 RepID=UPI00317F4A63